TYLNARFWNPILAMFPPEFGNLQGAVERIEGPCFSSFSLCRRILLISSLFEHVFCYALVSSNCSTTYFHDRFWNPILTMFESKF
ncbi:hypothetical protein MIMGU_mgv11b0218511mg, partial [Erythranthe guttata]